MARKNMIESHSHRNEILRTIAQGGAIYRNIAKQFWLSIAEISRYISGVGVRVIAKQFEKQAETAASIILEELKIDREVLAKMRSAAGSGALYSGHSGTI